MHSTSYPTNGIGYEIQTYTHKTGWVSPTTKPLKTRVAAEKQMAAMLLANPKQELRVYVAMSPPIVKVEQTAMTKFLKLFTPQEAM